MPPGAIRKITTVVPNFTGTNVVLTGILIVSDWRCQARRGEGDLPEELQEFCPEDATDWGLVTGHNKCLLYGDAADFKRYERGRVMISGLARGQKVAVDSIVPARLTDGEILDLIEELGSHRWTGPKNYTNPTHWTFDFTDPMLQILQAGSPAQEILMHHLNDREIKDQIIILLGGVGDERVVESITAGELAWMPVHTTSSTAGLTGGLKTEILSGSAREPLSVNIPTIQTTASINSLKGNRLTRDIAIWPRRQPNQQRDGEPL